MIPNVYVYIYVLYTISIDDYLVLLLADYSKTKLVCGGRRRNARRPHCDTCETLYLISYTYKYNTTNNEHELVGNSSNESYNT